MTTTIAISTDPHREPIHLRGPFARIEQEVAAYPDRTWAYAEATELNAVRYGARFLERQAEYDAEVVTATGASLDRCIARAVRGTPIKARDVTISWTAGRWHCAVATPIHEGQTNVVRFHADPLTAIREAVEAAMRSLGIQVRIVADAPEEPVAIPKADGW